jgi:hypothetical protein
MTDQTADVLVAEARRAVHDSLTLLPARGADRVRALIADLETAVESRTAIQCADRAVQELAVDRAALREAARLVAEYTGNEIDANAQMLLRLADGSPRPDDPQPAGVLPAPADRAAILRAVVTLLDQRASSLDVLSSSDFGEEARAVRELADVADVLRRMADETPAAETAALSPTERTMLTYALDQAQEHIWSRDGFTDEDQAAVDSLRRLAAEQPAAGARQDGAQR